MSKKPAAIKIGEVTTSPPQDLECSFCGQKASNTMAAVISSQSASVICADCVAQFATCMDQVYDALTEGAEGATFH